MGSEPATAHAAHASHASYPAHSRHSTHRWLALLGRSVIVSLAVTLVVVSFCGGAAVALFRVMRMMKVSVVVVSSPRLVVSVVLARGLGVLI